MNIRQACYFTPFNEGAIRIYPHGSELAADGQVFALLSRHIGCEIVTIENTNELLDMVCTRPIDSRKLYLSVINRSIGQTQPLQLPFAVSRASSVLLLPHQGNVMADNFDLIEIDKLTDTLPPLSIAFLQLDIYDDHFQQIPSTGTGEKRQVITTISD